MFSFYSKGYPQNKQITYAGMLWLLAAQLVVMLPLMFYLPIWLLPVLIFSTGLRIRVMQGRLTQPGALTKTVIGGVGIGGLFISGIPVISLNMMASLLTLGFAYKSLEVIQRRDGIVVVLTGFVLVGVLFLYSQSMLTALYGFLSVTVLTATMIAIQQSKSTFSLDAQADSKARNSRTKSLSSGIPNNIMPNLRLASLMLLLCLPLMLVLFVFVPRFAPLWTVALPTSHAKTGITDRMTPGDIANLSQSDELAFRVTFSGERPPQNELYWRGMVLQHFDGATWTQFDEELDSEALRSRLKTSEHQMKKRLVKKGYGRQYEVIYEKSAQPWLFALSPVVDIQGDALFGSDFRIMAYQDLFEPILLKLTSFPQALREVDMSESARKLALQLPEKGNNKSRELALELFRSSISPQDYIQKVLNRYSHQEFFYTLRPPTLTRTNSIDDFLLGSKKGFCAHYAGSFVYMMRVAGIPARVIAGYQGGEWNDKGDYLAVHQYDAHAWTEVWLENKGWVRFDPTAMVAPERVEKNLETAVKAEGSFLENQILSGVKYNWFDGIRQQVDSSQYAWRKFVLGYDRDARNSLVKRLFGELSILKIVSLICAFFIVMIATWFVVLGLGKKQQHEAVEHLLYRRFCALLVKHGIERKCSQSPAEFNQLAIVQVPELSTEINEFTQVYTSLCYVDNEVDEQQKLINRLKALIRAIKNH